LPLGEFGGCHETRNSLGNSATAVTFRASVGSVAHMHTHKILVSTGWPKQDSLPPSLALAIYQQIARKVANSTGFVVTKF